MFLSAPNFSEGRDPDAIAGVQAAFASGMALLDAHSDPVHNRTVLTLSDTGEAMVTALARGALACVAAIDMRHHEGAHPCVGALDVCPVVWLAAADRDAAANLARAAARQISAEAGVPVFLYGDLASEPRRRERSYFRDGGLGELERRMASGDLRPDFGPEEPHPSGGATLVTARPPLAAFNVELEAGMDGAREVAAQLRESGGGPAGLRAIAVDLGDGRVQISTNVHDPVGVPLADVVARVRVLGERHRAGPLAAEIVGLIPEAALEGFPGDVPLVGFDPARQVIERRIPGLRR